MTCGEVAYLDDERWASADNLMRYLTERTVLYAHDLQTGTESQLEWQVV